MSAFLLSQDMRHGAVIGGSIFRKDSFHSLMYHGALTHFSGLLCVVVVFEFWRPYRNVDGSAFVAGMRLTGD